MQRKPDSPLETLELLDQVGRGELDAHVWRSRNHPGILMSVVYVDPGEVVEDTNCPNYWSSYDPYYDGVMPTDEAIEKHKRMKAALARDEDYASRS